MSSWIAQLRPASFRGVPFGVLGDERTVGRRLAAHEFPDGDIPFAEDLGRAMPVLPVRGFLVGDDAIAQRDRLELAAETRGPGTLVHPTKGRLLVSLRSLTVSEQWDEGRYFELRFDFIEAGDASALSIVVNTANLVLNVLSGAGASAGAALGASLSDIVSTDPSNANAALGSAQPMTSAATALAAQLEGSGATSVAAAAAALNVAASGAGVAVSAGAVSTAADTLFSSVLSAASTPGQGFEMIDTLYASV